MDQSSKERRQRDYAWWMSQADAAFQGDEEALKNLLRFPWHPYEIERRVNSEGRFPGIRTEDWRTPTGRLVVADPCSAALTSATARIANWNTNGAPASRMSSAGPHADTFLFAAATYPAGYLWMLLGELEVEPSNDTIGDGGRPVRPAPLGVVQRAADMRADEKRWAETWRVTSAQFAELVRSLLSEIPLASREPMGTNGRERLSRNERQAVLAMVSALRAVERVSLAPLKKNARAWPTVDGWNIVLALHACGLRRADFVDLILASNGDFPSQKPCPNLVRWCADLDSFEGRGTGRAALERMVSDCLSEVRKENQGLPDSYGK